MGYIVILAALGAIVVYILRRGGFGPKHKELQRRYLKQLRLPPQEGAEILQRELERVQHRYPGRSERWYLEKILYDLERDQG